MQKVANMNNNSTYHLEKYSGLKSRFTCPACGKHKEFVRYIDHEGNYLNNSVGKCNRQVKCGYHKTPKQYFSENPSLKIQPSKIVAPKDNKKKSPTYIDFKVIKQSCKQYEKNNFASFLFSRFDKKDVLQTLKKYHVGTSKHWKGTTVFPQIDSKGKVRTAKIMLYDKSTGKRVKKPYNHITWLHSVLGLKDFNLNQCLFGEHLISQADTVCIVESEKTAIIASLVHPKYTWLATGGINGGKIEQHLFKGKRTILFPDLGVDWTMKAELIQGAAISDLLEKISTQAEKEKGFDIADFLLKQETNSNKEVSKERKQELNPNNKIFETMAKRNPSLIELKEKLGLMIAGSRKIEPEKKDSGLLFKIAFNAIGENNHTHKSKIPMFSELLKQNLIMEAIPITDYYFLTGSSPF